MSDINILTIIIGAIFSLAFAVIGYYVASTQKSRQIGVLTAERAQTLQSLAAETAQLISCQGQLKVAETRTQELQIDEANLLARLDASSKNENRLAAELTERKNETLDLQSRLDSVIALRYESVDLPLYIQSPFLSYGCDNFLRIYSRGERYPSALCG
ncbi:hypothetical protein SI35_06110 [Salmonella enterica]|nr:hypothetical protein [Salmonella enterica]EGG4133869.1 hypothetical protein [Salmonella enterica]